LPRGGEDERRDAGETRESARAPSKSPKASHPGGNEYTRARAAYFPGPQRCSSAAR
jgi:hypothetical protein